MVRKKKSVLMQKVHFKRSEIVLLLSSTLTAITGAVCNSIVRAANSGKMPVFLSWEWTLTPGEANTHIAVYGTSTKLAFLADRINLGLHSVSIGDFLIWTGILAWFILAGIVSIRMYSEAKSKLGADESAGR